MSRDLAKGKIRGREHLLLLGIVLSFVILGVTYSFVNPLFESPDERWHFAFAKHLAERRELPIQPPEKFGHSAAQEASQPPLYYLIGALGTFWVNTADYESLLWDNPQWDYDAKNRRNDNRNLYVHPPEQTFSFTGTVLAARLIRWLSVLFGTVTILCTYVIAKEVLPANRDLALAAAAMVAFAPQFIFIHSSVTNDSAISASSSLFILLLIRAVKRGLSKRISIALGLVLGLALLTKLSALALIPLSATALGLRAVWLDSRSGNLGASPLPLYASGKLWSGIRSRAMAGLTGMRYLPLSFLVAGLVAGWWYLRNWWLYGELLGTEMMQDVFGHRRPTPTLQVLLSDLPMVQQSFWAAFSWGTLLVDEWIYVALNVLVGLAGLGLLFGLAKRTRHLLSMIRGHDCNPLERIRIICFGVLTFWCLLIFAALLRWMQVNYAPLGRLLLPALGAASILILVGIGQFVRESRRRYVYGLLATLFLIFAIMVPLRFLAPAYAMPATFAPSVQPKIQNPTALVFDEAVELLGYDLDVENDQFDRVAGGKATELLTVSPGATLKLTLYWRPIAELSDDVLVFVQLADAASRSLGQRHTYPGSGKYPTSLWKPGVGFRDIHYVLLKADVDAPLLASLRVGLYNPQTQQGLPVRQGNSSSDNSIDISFDETAPELTKFKVMAAGRDPEVLHSLTVPYKNGVSLEGYRVDVGGERQLVVTLLWRVRQPPGKDYTVFTHLVNDNSVRVAQQDSPPRNGLYPTSTWAEGEEIIDRHVIVLPPNLASGSYQLRVGLYELVTGERVDSIEGNLTDRSVILDVPAF